jgi:outer membrane biosynthesis protein TonB
VFFGKESEKPSEEKPVERPSEEKPVENPSGEKPSEQPQPKPKPKLVRFHSDYCGRYGHKGEFCFKRKREEIIAKKWVTRISTTLPMVYLSLVCRCPGPR